MSLSRNRSQLALISMNVRIVETYPSDLKFDAATVRQIRISAACRRPHKTKFQAAPCQSPPSAKVTAMLIAVRHGYSESNCRSTSDTPGSLLHLPTSGSAGTSRSRAGYVITYTYLSVATKIITAATLAAEPQSILSSPWHLVDYGTVLPGTSFYGVFYTQR